MSKERAKQNSQGAEEEGASHLVEGGSQKCFRSKCYWREVATF